MKLSPIQECIPVGCVPPAAVALRGVSTRHPPDQAPAPEPGTPQTRHPPRTRHLPWTRHPPVDRHTPVNILPCPILRLRAVISNSLLCYCYRWEAFLTVECDGVFPKCFYWIQQIQWQKYLSWKGLKPAISCLRDQDATTVSARHM